MKQFNTWERYFDPKHPKHKYEFARYSWFMDRVCGPAFLNVGCSGGLALFLAAKKDGIKELCGVDTREDIVELAAVRLSSYRLLKRVRIQVSCAEFLPYEDKRFNCVLLGETFEQVVDDQQTANECFRVMKSGGVLLISALKDGHLLEKRARLHTKESLNNLVSLAGFTVTETDEMKAGSYGDYLLIQAVK